MQMFYHPILDEALNTQGGLKKMAKDSAWFRHPISIIDKGRKKRNEFINTYKKAGQIVESDSMLCQIFDGIQRFDSHAIEFAINRDYTRRLAMNDKESKRFIIESKGMMQMPIEDMIYNFFQGKISGPDYIPETVNSLFEYTINNIWNDFHAEFLCSMLDKLKNNKESHDHFPYPSIPINNLWVVKLMNACDCKKSSEIRGKIYDALNLIFQLTNLSNLDNVLWSSFSAPKAKNCEEENSITEELYSCRGPNDVLKRPCNKIMLMLCIAYTRKYVELLPTIPDDIFKSDYMMFNVFEKDEQFSYYRHFRKGMEFAAKNIELSKNNQRNYLKYMITRENPFNFNSINYQLHFCCKLYIMLPLSLKLLQKAHENPELLSLIQEFRRMCEEALACCNMQIENTPHRAFTDAVRKTIAMPAFVTKHA